MNDRDDAILNPGRQDRAIAITEEPVVPHVFGIDPIADLDHLIGDDPEARRMLAQERVRVWLADVLCMTRQALGLTQQDMADRLGISQGRISRLESCHYDRRMDSVAGYLHAAGAELLMAVRVGDQVFEVAGTEEGWRQAAEVLGARGDSADDEAANRGEGGEAVD